MAPLLVDAAEDQCHFYLEMNQQIKCGGNSNYLLNYGHKYCQQFLELELNKRSSKQLVTWISGTKICLQEMLKDNPNRYKGNCEQLKEFAYDVHPICYKQYGVCDLSSIELSRVAKVIVKNDFVTDFEKSKRATFMQSMNVLTSCMSASKTISKSGEMFYNIFLRDKVSLAVEGVMLATEIIDRAPDTLDKMEAYFSDLIAKMKSDKNQQIKSDSVSKLSNMVGTGFDSNRNLVMNRDQLPASMEMKEFGLIQSKVNQRTTIEDMRKAVQRARELSQ